MRVEILVDVGDNETPAIRREAPGYANVLGGALGDERSRRAIPQLECSRVVTNQVAPAVGCEGDGPALAGGGGDRRAELARGDVAKLHPPVLPRLVHDLGPVGSERDVLPSNGKRRGGGHDPRGNLGDEGPGPPEVPFVDRPVERRGIEGGAVGRERQPLHRRGMTIEDRAPRSGWDVPHHDETVVTTRGQLRAIGAEDQASDALAMAGEGGAVHAGGDVEQPDRDHRRRIERRGQRGAVGAQGDRRERSLDPAHLTPTRDVDDRCAVIPGDEHRPRVRQEHHVPPVRRVERVAQHRIPTSGGVPDKRFRRWCRTTFEFGVDHGADQLVVTAHRQPRRCPLPQAGQRRPERLERGRIDRAQQVPESCGVERAHRVGVDGQPAVCAQGDMDRLDLRRRRGAPLSSRHVVDTDALEGAVAASRAGSSRRASQPGPRTRSWGRV